MPSLPNYDTPPPGRKWTPPEIRRKGITWKIEDQSSQDSEADRDARGFRLLRQTAIGGKKYQYKLDIHRIHHISQLYSLYVQDFFHTLVNLKLRVSITLCGIVYMAAFSILAAAFWSINDSCELGMENKMEAFALSVETWLTIGYGLPETPGPYLRDCWSAVFIVTAQGIVGLILNAFLVGLVITRVHSGAKRGCSLAFSDKAAIREVNGRIYFMVQICEMRQTQLLEAHVRAYVIRSPACPSEMLVDAPQAFEMRLSRPDDDLGALVLPVLPTIIVHEIDSCSPLGPPSAEDDPLRFRHWTRPSQRAVDADCGSRSFLWCRTCGDQFPTQEMLDAHMEYQAEQDRLAGATDRPHQKPDRSDIDASQRFQELMPESWRRQVSKFLGRGWFEILVILEGVDTTTAATVQARHSYVAEDIVWDHTFTPMFSVDPQKRSATIDYTKINDLVAAPPQQ